MESLHNIRSQLPPHNVIGEEYTAVRLDGCCALCNNLDKKFVGIHRAMVQHRLAFDFSPLLLQKSSRTCQFCKVIMKALEQFLPEIRHTENSVAWIYARGSAKTRPHTLSFEIYFQEARPKLELEVYALSELGTAIYSVVVWP